MNSRSRRALLSALGAAALSGAAGCTHRGANAAVDGGTATARAAGAGDADRRVEVVGEGTEQTTELHVVDASIPGPTFFLVGGVHGDEVSGWRAATAATEWRIDAGRLVVLPRANPGVIRRDARKYPEGVDLNRQFLIEERPETPYARAIWAAIRRHDPDVFLDLHSSLGIYGWGGGYVGQHVFHSTHPRIESACAAAVDALNERFVADRTGYAFGHSNLSTEKGMIATKVAADLGVPAALFETTRKGTSLRTRVEWTTAFARDLLGR